MDINTIRAEIEALEAAVRRSLKEDTIAQQIGDLGTQIVGFRSHVSYLYH